MREVIILDFDEIKSAEDMLDAFENHYGIFVSQEEDIAFFDTDSITTFNRGMHTPVWDELFIERMNKLSQYARRCSQLKIERMFNSKSKL